MNIYKTPGNGALDISTQDEESEKRKMSQWQIMSFLSLTHVSMSKLTYCLLIKGELPSRISQLWQIRKTPSLLLQEYRDL